MLLKSCNKCGALVPYGIKHCDKCREIAQQEDKDRQAESKRRSDKRYNQKRNKKTVQFYRSIEWRMLAARYTQDKLYKCEECGAIGTQVHHIKPIQTPEGWAMRLDYNNLKLLCNRCHNKQHDRFVKKHPQGWIKKF